MFSQFVRASALAAMIVASVGVGVHAQTPPHSAAAAPVGTVTVVGKRPAEKDVIKTVIAPFVDLHAARDKKTGLLVRAPADGVCPITLGLSPAYNDFVTARIVEVAKSVGAAVRKVGSCKPNVEVIFTPAPQELMNTLAKRTGGGILGFHYPGAETQLVHVSRPIQAWYMTGTISNRPAYATRLVEAAGLQDTVRDQLSAQGGVVADHAYWQDPYSGTGSRLSPKNSSQLMNVLIVADLGKLDGWEIGSISDYAAMLSLSQVGSLDTCNTLPSILDLLASDCQGRAAPQALTDSDTAFLKALYASDLSTTGDQARYHIEHGMVRDAAAAKP